jgi:hypothetical protein
MSTALRRIFLLLVATVVAGGAAVTLRNRRLAAPAPQPQWPPFEPAPVEPAPVERIHVGLVRHDHASFIEPPSSGTVPDEYPIKAKDSSKIFHVPGGTFYERTKADRLYASADAAIDDGYRPSKS